MVQTQQAGVADFYTKAFKSWSDMLSQWTEMASSYPGTLSSTGMENMFKPWSEVMSTWTKTVGSFHPEQFGTGGLDNWFKPYGNYMDSWTKAYQGFADGSKGSGAHLESMKEMNQTVAKAINSYVSIHDAWVRNMDAASRQGYEIGRRLIAGEDAEIGDFFETLKTAYEDSTNSLMEALKSTPFSGIEQIDQELKNSLDAFPEEQEMAKNLIQELFRFNTKMMNISTSGMKDASTNLTSMMEKGTISSDSYKNMMDTYAETLKQCLEIMRPPAAVLPGYKIMVDAVIGSAEKNLDMMTAWLEINLKLYEGIGKSSGEISQSTSEMFKDEQNLAPDEFYKKWSQAWEKATQTMVQKTELEASIPTFLRKYTEWLKSIENVYESATAIPYVTKDDLDGVAYEVEKVKASLSKKSKAEKSED